MNNKINNRDSNIELLRIFSMILIICFHYIYKSNFQYNELTFNNLIIKSGWFLGELGVNLFILITGYYLCKSKPTIKKTILLIIQIIFYNLINYVIGYSLKYNGLTDISLIFPIITKKYWFITAYLLVYILSPYCNKLINKLTKREFQKFLLINLVIWCLIPTIFGFFYNTTEELLFYNRFIWLLFMYFIGSYIRIYNIKFLNSKKRSLLTSSLTFLLMIISIIILYIFKSTFTRIGTTETAYFWTPNNILMFVLSIVIAFTIVSPWLFIGLYKWTNRWTMKDISERKKRFIPYLLTMMSYGTCLILMYRMHFPTYFSGIIVSALMCMAICTLLNLHWRVSIHMAGCGMFIGGLIAYSFLFLFNPIWWLCGFILITGIQGTARISYHQHTLLEIFIGFVAGMFCGITGILFI